MSNNVRIVLFLVLLSLALAACQDGARQGQGSNEDTAQLAGPAMLALPPLAAVRGAQDGPLQVVATTSIIGDVLAQVGGNAIALTTLMAPGQDPHSYEPSTADLTGVARADVIFVNGWDLEEGLVDDLANIAGDAPLVPISAGIEPLSFGASGSDEEAHGDAAADPHVWLDPQLVQQWVRNSRTVLSSLDPANAAQYEANAEAYEAELAALDARLAESLGQVASERRKLVTNHDALAYFARRYDFEIVGTVIPAASTLAEPSAQEMVSLVQKMREEAVCTVFAESTANARLAETIAAELEGCERVQVVSLYTGALGAPGSGAESYLQMMRLNGQLVVQGLGG